MHARSVRLEIAMYRLRSSDPKSPKGHCEIYARTRIFFALVPVQDVPDPNPNINPKSNPDPNTWTGTSLEKKSHPALPFSHRSSFILIFSQTPDHERERESNTHLFHPLQPQQLVRVLPGWPRQTHQDLRQTTHSSRFAGGAQTILPATHGQ